METTRGTGGQGVGRNQISRDRDTKDSREGIDRDTFFASVSRACASLSRHRGHDGAQDEASGPGAALRESVDLVLDRMDGPRLDLSTLTERECDQVFAIWPEICRSLQACAEGPGLDTVTLQLSADQSRDPGTLGKLCDGLNRLTQLSSLSVVLPREAGIASLNLGALSERAHLTVWVSGLAGLRITVHESIAEVLAISNERPVLEKAWVYYVDRDGKPSRIRLPEPLGNLLHHEVSGIFVAGLDGKHREEALLQAVAFNLNGRKGFPRTHFNQPQFESPQGMLCRHLAAKRLNEWVRLDNSIETKSGARQSSYGPFGDGGGLSTFVESSTERDYRRAPGCAVFSADQFGSMVAFLMEKAMGGKPQHYMLCTTAHVTSIRIRPTEPGKVKLIFYDPIRTKTRTHILESKLGLAQLSRQRLSKWATEDDTQGTIHTLYSWPPRKDGQTVPESIADEAIFVSQADRGSTSFVYCLLRAGDADRVRQFLGELLKGGRYITERLSIGFEYAMERGQTRTANAFMECVFNTPGIDGPRTEQLFKGRKGGPLYAALQSAEAATAAMYARTVIRADLYDDTRIILLKSQGALAKVCKGTTVPFQAPGTLEARHQSIYEFACEVAAAPETSTENPPPTLTLTEKREILFEDNPARKALRCHNPGAAGALYCAILDRGVETGAVALLQDAQPSIREVLTAIVVQGRPSDHKWLGRILAALTGCGLPASEVQSLVAEFSGVADGPPPVPAEPAHPLIGRFVCVPGETSEAYCTTAELHAFQVENADGKGLSAGGQTMVCRATHSVNRLEKYRVDKSGVDDKSPQAADFAVYYRIPIEKLQATAIEDVQMTYDA